MTSLSIEKIAYAFPAASRSVRELAGAGLLKSEPSVLEGFGFERIHVAEGESPFELALEAAEAVLSENAVDREAVGLLIYTGTPGAAAFHPASAAAPATSFLRTTERFRFPATRLQYELGLTNASVIALDQLACNGLFGAIRVAGALCVAEGIDRALCVSADFFPADAGREAIFNCTSDAACSVLVRAGGISNRIVASVNITKGYYWDAEALEDQIVASYFPTARHAIAEVLRKAGWEPASVDWVIPHNVSVRSWDVLLRLAGLAEARVWLRNVARDGHTLAGDNFINLRDALSSGSVSAGERLLLFSYGYGAHWTALALEA